MNVYSYIKMYVRMLEDVCQNAKVGENGKSFCRYIV